MIPWWKNILHLLFDFVTINIINGEDSLGLLLKEILGGLSFLSPFFNLTTHPNCKGYMGQLDDYLIKACVKSYLRKFYELKPFNNNLIHKILWMSKHFKKKGPDDQQLKVRLVNQKLCINKLFYLYLYNITKLKSIIFSSKTFHMSTVINGRLCICRALLFTCSSDHYKFNLHEKCSI